jgi:acyl carrier protein
MASLGFRKWAHAENQLIETCGARTQECGNVTGRHGSLHHTRVPTAIGDQPSPAVNKGRITLNATSQRNEILPVDQSEFIALIEETLEASSGTVKMGDTLSDIDWDSLANISFIAALDSSHGVTVDADALAKCETVDDLFVLTQSAIKAS